MNPFREINWKPDVHTRRQFALSLIIGFPALALVSLIAEWPRGAGWNFAVPLALGSGGAALGLILWIAPQIARPFYLIWHLAAACMGFVIGNAVLTAVYLLLLVPIGLALRAMGRSGLTKGFDRNASTYWRDAGAPDAPERYYRQF